MKNIKLEYLHILNSEFTIKVQKSRQCGFSEKTDYGLMGSKTKVQRRKSITLSTNGAGNIGCLCAKKRKGKKKAMTLDPYLAFYIKLNQNGNMI